MIKGGIKLHDKRGKDDQIRTGNILLISKLQRQPNATATLESGLKVETKSEI